MLLRQLYTQQPTQQQLADYTNAVLSINSYAYSITNQKLPVLQYPPSNYGDFAIKFYSAKQHSLNWTDNIFVSLIQLPVTIKEQATDLFNLEEMMIESYLNTLIADPTNAKAKKDLAGALADIQKLINTQATTVTSIQSSLKQFNLDIFEDAKELTGISQKAFDDAGADQTMITNIQTDINNLKADIHTAQILLTVSEFSIGLGIFFGIVGVWVCLLPGGQAIGGGMIAVAVAGTAASIAGTVVESLRIKSMQAEIDSDQTQIDGLKQDVILLNAVSTQFNDLYNANLKAQNALTAIGDMWTNLDTTIEAVKTELATVDSDTTSAQYQDALTAFKQAETNWNEVVAFANTLASITYNWQDASGAWHDFSAQSPQADQGNVTPIPSKIPQAA